jgi:hypothetical protein
MAVKPGPAMGKWGAARTVDPTYLFGTQEEIDNRVHTGYDNPPDHHVPHFVQISPVNTGKNTNNAGQALRSGNLKFSKGPY